MKPSGGLVRCLVGVVATVSGASVVQADGLDALAAPARSALAAPVSEPRPEAVAGSSGSPVGARATATAAGSLSGKVVVVDPGHQLGNATHPAKVNRLVDAGGFLKACNSTGTATNHGFPEATFDWLVARSLTRQLRSRGATVYLTRHTNSSDDWGPCIDVRGRRGNKVQADAVISIHADGADSAVRGFFVIRPSNRAGWTDDIAAVSRRYAHKVKAGLVHAGVRISNSYGGDGLDVRGDLGTLNWSNVPIVLVELGNMRNAVDARHMRSATYRRHRYARALRIGVTRFVLHR